MDQLLLDVKHTARGLLQNKLLTGGAALALAIGIGATTTLFSIVHGGLKDLPFAQPDELVLLTRIKQADAWTNRGGTPFDIQVWSRDLRSFEGVSAFTTLSINLAGDDRAPERVSGALIAPNAFSLLGAQPLRGRGLRAEDAAPGAPSVALIGHSLWQARFAGDADIVGRTIRVNGEPRTIVGVMPEGFGFPVSQSMWLPLQQAAAPAAADESEWFTVFGRLRDGVSLAESQAELNTFAARLARDYPASHGGRQNIRVAPIVEMEFDPNTGPLLYTMLLAISFVLVIACANVANLLLARAARRSRETAVRIALGASRKRIIGQQLMESGSIAIIGGLGGVAIAYVGVRFFDLASANILQAFWVDFKVDGTVLGFATLLVGGAGILAGLVPALRASAVPAAVVLKESTASGLRMGRFSRVLVAGELALACGLLVVSGILVKSAIGQRAVQFPFADTAILTAQLGFGEESTGAQRTRDITLMQEQLSVLPGVQAAGMISTLPGRGAGSQLFALDGATYERVVDQPTTGVVMITPGTLDVLDGKVLRGRGIEWSDVSGAPRVALVNQSWVRRFSADREPIGRSIRLWREEAAIIVGIVPDLQVQDPGDPRGDAVYLSALQYEPYSIRVMLRGAGDVIALTPHVRTAIATINPDLPLFEVATLRDAIYADSGVLDAFGTLFGIFGAGALFLTMIGLYGVVSFSVTQRTRELGIRMSLGATRRNIVTLVLKSGGKPLAIGGALGILLGIAISLALAVSGEDALKPDPRVFVGVIAALGSTALVALLIPARRAARLDPQAALRTE